MIHISVITSSVIIMSNDDTTDVQKRITGRVKWFNNRAGFGFVTACEGELFDKDVFVHYSSIRVPNDQYKYLVQGEYVDFEITKSDKTGHEFHAVNISGVKGGNLMCETRKQTMESRPYKPRIYKTPDESETQKSGGAGKERRVPVASTKSDRTRDKEGFTKVPTRRPKNKSAE